ncbi:hypothetical protein CDL15_Pgr029044 [Punica granatum]|uniref:Uncharacterized protein n=1 Tax=Punica granatum TaxID=22663 RepID=A0A218XMC0_PUNGR|nr:hypothetical protein CDL15_Pgr029044 [Punica granatum]PKI69197.1 hypothetical protein CRG98_010402 [Punica granatum]
MATVEVAVATAPLAKNEAPAAEVAETKEPAAAEEVPGQLSLRPTQQKAKLQQKSRPRKSWTRLRLRARRLLQWKRHKWKGRQRKLLRSTPAAAEQAVPAEEEKPAAEEKPEKATAREVPAEKADD